MILDLDLCVTIPQVTMILNAIIIIKSHFIGNVLKMYFAAVNLQSQAAKKDSYGRDLIT